jgi:vanillate O-demethylase monooxygenase subunit
MTFLRNTWYMAMWSENLAEGKLLPRMLLGIPLVFWRDSQGRVAALEDRCPHRFAPLSKGKLLGDRIQCGYHGLEFDGSGACVRNPHVTGRIPPAAKVPSFPIVERHAAVWIWMGEPKAADPSLIPNYDQLDDLDNTDVVRRDYLLMKVPDHLIIDNILDCSHTCFVHEGILGNAEMIPVENRVEQVGNTVWVRRWMPNVPPPKTFQLAYQPKGATVDLWTVVRWDPPGCILLDAGVTECGQPKEAGSGFVGVHIVTPETETTAHYHFSGRRYNMRPGTIAPGIREELADLRRFAFEEQDEPMIQAQLRNMQLFPPDRLKPVMLETDVGIVRRQRVMDRLLAAEQH